MVRLDALETTHSFLGVICSRSVRYCVVTSSIPTSLHPQVSVGYRSSWISTWANETKILMGKKCESFLHLYTRTGLYINLDVQILECTDNKSSRKECSNAQRPYYSLFFKTNIRELFKIPKMILFMVLKPSTEQKYRLVRRNPSGEFVLSDST